MPIDLEQMIKSALSDIVSSSPLPEPDELSYYILEHERKFYLDCEISPYVNVLHRMILRWNMEDKGKPVEERKPIWLYIMSYGGDTQYMWALIDIIMASETPIYTVNIGMAGSAAALIFLAGSRRYMMKNSQLVIHEGYAEMSGDAVKVMDATDNYKKELDKMKRFVEKRTTIPFKIINKKRNNDWYLDADFCLENGACERIVANLSEVI